MKRFVSALWMTVLLCTLAAFAGEQPTDRLVDRTSLIGLTQDNLLNQNNARHDGSLSRAELAQILVRAFDLDPQSQPKCQIQLDDVPVSHRAYHDIQTVLCHNIMTGYRAGRFFPDQRVTRAEAFSILAQAHGVFQFSDQAIAQILDRYADAAEIPDWARKSMATALHEGLVNTRANNEIDPLSPMTRDDVAYALNIYLQRQN